jgi:ABC-type nitrate/sulfonate/bicarbonate transport system substrate-binding protein
MKEVRVSGVPEHFNLPWHMAIDEGAFAARGIALTWTEVPEGTGRMCQMLQDGETDLAVLLTEGIIKSVCGGNKARILQEYVASPLLWGIHVSADSGYKRVEDLKNTRVAISRPGSGSHLMAYLLARERNWPPTGLEFETVHNLEGAVKALTAGRAGYFMWEHFTTKPLVDTGVFRRLGDFPTPWPCFVIAASHKFLTASASVIPHVLEVINMYSSEFRNIPSIDRTLANRYGQKPEDIREWLGGTRWSQEQIGSETVSTITANLLSLDLIENTVPVSEICYP